MRIPDFEVRNQRGLRYAKCESVPRLMIVAGPNGAGKSTLLYSMRNIGGRQNILYIGPHRASRRQQVRQRFLISATLNYESYLARDDSPTVEGIQQIGGGRDPWSYDDSANYIKHSLCQIEVERQQAIAIRYDRDRFISPDTIIDPWSPLRELTNNLLPHLEFSRIDNDNRDSIRCLWRVHSKNMEVDYDDLSSGEKSIIQMFYPLVEHRIRTLLIEIKRVEQEPNRPAMCILIDEPELHLHPNLQVKVYDYFRMLTSQEDMQVILASHSPTIVEYASFEELFILRPIDLIKDGENQLVQVASDEERLNVLRELFGTTSNITAMQPIVVVEGVAEAEQSKVIADRKLYRILHKRFDSVIIVPGGGESECRRLVTTLNGALHILSDKLQAVALLDSDLVDDISSGIIYRLPVSMIENFILDPAPIWQALQSVVEKSGFESIEDVDAAITSIMDELDQTEIERRAKYALGSMRFRPESPLSEISTQLQRFMVAVERKYSVESVLEKSSQSQVSVAELKLRNQRRERYHGKEAVKLFYGRHIHKTGMPKDVFIFEAMRHAATRKSTGEFFEEFFKAICPVVDFSE